MKSFADYVSEAKMNQRDYKFYLLNKKGDRIRSGWEYKEDAQDAKDDDPQSGKIVAKVSLGKMNLNPDDNKNWGGMNEEIEPTTEAMSVGAKSLLKQHKNAISTMMHKTMLADDDLGFDLVREAFTNLFQNMKESDIK